MQLWRVIEKSDVVVQIVDARNPLLFRCKDLERYVKEVDKSKKVLLLVNKADFLSPKMRDMWADSLLADGVDVVFFSAISQQNLDAATKRNELETRLRRAAMQRMGMKPDIPVFSTHHPHSETDEDVDDEEYSVESDLDGIDLQELKNNSPPKYRGGGFALLQDAENSDHEKSEDAENKYDDIEEEMDRDSQNSITYVSLSNDKIDFVADMDQGHADKCEASQKLGPDAKIEHVVDDVEYVAKSSVLNREELIDYFYSLKNNLGKDHLTIGMVGYPNVGKSSTINALIADHRVAVSSTPGKTRHFQTVNLNKDLTLCDCPGLVFPTFLSSKADMTCNGILPIDQLKNEDYLAPVNIVCNRISRYQFEMTYGLKFPLHLRITPHLLLEAYANWRGFVAGGGSANEAKCTRHILKDLVNGKLIFCQPPPNLTSEEMESFLNSLEKTRVLEEPEYNSLAQEYAIQEYALESKPKIVSSRSLKGTTKAKRRLRKQLKLGRSAVPNKGYAVDQREIEIHVSAPVKKNLNNFRRQEFPTNK